MADPAKQLLMKVLAACSGAEPLYPVTYSETAGIDRIVLDEALDRLRISGLVHLTEWLQGRGQGYAITPEGAMVLKSPSLLNRPPRPAPPPLTGAGDVPPSIWERGEAVRNVLLYPLRPTVTMVLLFLNVLVFVIGLAMAWQGGFTEAYIGGGIGLGGGEVRDPQKLMEAFEAHKLRFNFGGLSKDAVIAHNQWWRLLAYAFIHVGFLHILLNMLALYNLGPILETMWGHTRFLYLYFVSAFTGGAVVLLGDSHAITCGASGAICGLLASMGAWLILNRGHLPPQLTGRWLNQVFLNVILLAFMSTLPGVSWQGHLGGFVGGAVLSLPLNSQRFGAGRERLLGWLGLLAVPIVGLAVALYLNFP